jgi:hypothetical protein
MVERGIPEALIIEALYAPTKIARDTGRRLLIKKLYRKRGKERLLLLAVELENEVLCVVTIIDTTKVEKYL